MKTRTLSEPGLEVDYSTTDESFDYQGPNGTLTHKGRTSYEVERIAIFIEYSGEWLDVTSLQDKDLERIASSLIESDLEAHR